MYFKYYFYIFKFYEKKKGIDFIKLFNIVLNTATINALNDFV